MTPEQESNRFDAIHAKLDRLLQAQTNLTNVVLDHVQTDARKFDELGAKVEKHAEKAEDRHKHTWSAIRKLRDAGDQAMRGMRSKMPSLSAEDTGSFELHALGAGAKFRGRDGLRIGMALLVLSLIGAAGYTARAVTFRVEPAPVAGERK